MIFLDSPSYLKPKMTPTIFLTGATGFLGTQIAVRLLENPDLQIIALVRAPDDGSAPERLLREWWDFPALRVEIGRRIWALAGDITLTNLGLLPQIYQDLVQQTTHIVHAAADIRLFASLEELRLTNVTGTLHILEFAQAVHASNGLQRLEHISTAFVAGKRRGEIPEESLSADAGFISPYEQSKFEAECLIRRAGGKLPVTVLRPGMITGDSNSGEIKHFNTIYYPLRLYLTGRLAISPASPATKVCLVPVDYVAGAAARLLFDPRAVGRIFHLTPPPEASPTQSQIAHFARKWAETALGVRLPKARFIPLPTRRPVEWLASKVLSRDFSALARLLPYFSHQPIFKRTNSDELLGPYPHRWQDLLPPLLSYAARCNFWDRSSRSVYEQIMLRLESTARPITYHDLVAGNETLRSASEIRSDIFRLVQAFHAMGLATGDRVAIVGQNHSRYFCILVACGLAGIVSVPLYVTSPAAEIDGLLSKSRSKMLFAGAPEILQKVDAINCPIPIVSFCPIDPPLSGHRRVISWDDFLLPSTGKQDTSLPRRPMDAIACIYYTSGTTGEPKGVAYRQDQLRWMARTLAELYPWRERNRWGSYLSYLPMNHVVEGILATYSPYYAPAALDIYYLSEFEALPQALLKARPTIFFSVPRFFEKVRAVFLQNRLANFYFHLPQGTFRNLLARFLRKRLLRKTGLDRCRQIIVGSAPSSPELLSFYHQFGIDIHNAYGLTEAPLVSINRLGHSQPNSLGEPLPQTEINFEPDSEIKVRGPQVAAGYLVNDRIEPFQDDWLLTGDLGSLTTQGQLTISGRKRDIIFTAYGSKIFPGPVEAALRAIPEVHEALLIGDGRAFCAGLIWLEEGCDSAVCAARIHAGITRINAGLSHTEQIKRWAILPDRLTIDDGSLTGSMKMKRQVLTHRYAFLVDALYQDASPPENVIFGSAARKTEKPSGKV